MQMCDGQLSESSTICAYNGGVDMILRSTINTRQTLSTFHCININVYYISICMFLRKHISGVDDCGKQGADRPRILVGEYEDITAPKSSCESGCSFLFKHFATRKEHCFMTEGKVSLLPDK